jgi:hypothetical protein
VSRRIGALAAILLPAIAAADDRSDAEELFVQGRAAMAAKDYARACVLFEASLSKERATGTLLNLALCHEARGAVATAWGELHAVEDRSRAATPPQLERADFARKRADEVEPKIPRLRVHGAPGVAIAIDGRAAPEELLAIGAPVDLGEHEVAATAQHKRPWVARVRITELGSTQEVRVPSLADADQEPSAGADAPRAGRTIGFVVGGVGLASIATGAVFGLFAASKRGASQCPAPCTDDTAARRAYDSALLDANVANVTIGVGLLAVTVGLVLVLTSKNPARAPRAALVLPARTDR